MLIINSVVWDALRRWDVLMAMRCILKLAFAFCQIIIDNNNLINFEHPVVEEFCTVIHFSISRGFPTRFYFFNDAMKSSLTRSLFSALQRSTKLCRHMYHITGLWDPMLDQVLQMLLEFWNLMVLAVLNLVITILNHMGKSNLIFFLFAYQLKKNLRWEHSF